MVFRNRTSFLRSSATMAVVLIAGCTGGMGSILLDKIDSGGSFQGRPIELLIALDYFPGDAEARKAGAQVQPLVFEPQSFTVQTQPQPQPVFCCGVGLLTRCILP